MSQAGKKTDYRATSQDDTQERKFPGAVSTEYRVHLAVDAYDAMMAHAATSDEVELCGVLVGEVCRDDLGAFLVVEAVIPGEGTNNYGAQVTFTHETWAHINETKDKDYPDQKIVGWYHTHPGFGVFLSEMDTFIQENFFNMPYQVAIVVETRAAEEGCFAWVNGKSLPLRRYWVGDREVELVGGESKPFRGVSDAPRTAPVQIVAPARVGMLGGFSWSLVLFIGLAMMCGYFMGGVRATRELRTIAGQFFEMELYSLFEKVALSEDVRTETAAARTELDKLAQFLKDKDYKAAEGSAVLMQTRFAQLDTIHARQSSALRKEMTAVGGRRGSLTAQMRELRTAQRLVNRMMAELSLLRVADFLNAGNTRVLSEMPPEKRAFVTQYIKQAVQMAPEMKEAIRRAFPEILEQIYPQPKPKPPVKPKDDDARTTGGGQ